MSEEREWIDIDDNCCDLNHSIWIGGLSDLLLKIFGTDVPIVDDAFLHY